MTLQDMVIALIDTGLSQASIAQACHTSQPVVWRASKGIDIRYSTGKEIERFYKNVMRARKAA